MNITKYGKVTIDFSKDSAKPEIIVSDFDAYSDSGEDAMELGYAILRMARREIDEMLRD